MKPPIKSTLPLPPSDAELARRMATERRHDRLLNIITGAVWTLCLGAMALMVLRMCGGGA